MRPEQALPTASAMQVIGHPVAYYPSFVKALGNVKCAIFISQFLYWLGKGRDKDQWIYKTANELKSETGLSYEEQKRVRKKLKKLNLLEERLSKVPARMHFRFRWDLLDALLVDGPPESLGTQSQQSSESESKEACDLNEEPPDLRRGLLTN